VKAPSGSSVRLLLVVRPHEQKLYDYLVGRLRAIDGVDVVMERRKGERREGGQSVGVERRNDDRRRRRGDVSALGYTVVRLRPGRR
jgi:hypothetical protein